MLLVLDWKILQVVTYIHILPNTILSKRSLLNYLEVARTKLNLFLVKWEVKKTRQRIKLNETD